VLALALIACRRDDPTDAAPTAPDPPEAPAPLPVVARDALVERVVDPPVEAAIPAGAGVLWSAGAEGGVTTAEGQAFPLRASPRPTDAADVQGRLFAAVEGRVAVWVGDALVDAGFDLPPARALLADGDALWIETEAGAFRWRDGALSELTVDGGTVDARIAAGPSFTGQRVAWLAVGAEIHGFATSASAVQGFESRSFGAPIDAALVVDGALLLAEGGRLWRRDAAGWARIALRSPVADLLGGPGGAWLRTGEGLWLWRGAELWALRAPPEVDGRWFADDLGRLLVRTDAGLDRWTLHRPLRVAGLSAGDRLDVSRTVEVIATAPEALQDLQAAVEPSSGAPIPIPLVDGAGLLDPAALPVGPATLRITAAYPDQTSALALPFTVEVVGEVTWSGHVRPIHEARCASCHADSANTVLDGPEAWESAFDEILENVASGAMPLVGDPLAAAQVELVEAWAAGGFRP
jgi:mono/diheme cytochrome c family protein